MIFAGGYGHNVWFDMYFPKTMPYGRVTVGHHIVIAEKDYIQAQPSAFEKLAIDVCKLKHKGTSCSIAVDAKMEMWGN